MRLRRRWRSGAVALMLGLVVGSAGCGDVHQKTQAGQSPGPTDRTELPDPSEGLGRNVVGEYVSGSSLYWMAHLEQRHDPEDSGYLPSRLLGEVRWYDSIAGRWVASDRLPGVPASRIIQGAVVNGQLLVLYNDCDDTWLDEDVQPRICDPRPRLVRLDDGGSWTALAPEQISVGEAQAVMRPLGDGVLVRVQDPAGAVQHLLVPLSGAAATLLASPPGVFATYKAMESPCVIDGGLLLWTPYWGQADQPVSYDSASADFAESGTATSSSGVAVSLVAPDGSFGTPVYVPGLLVSSDKVGCTPSGVVLPVIDARPGTSRPTVLVEVGSDGATRTLEAPAPTLAGSMAIDVVPFGGDDQPPILPSDGRITVLDPASLVATCEFPRDERVVALHVFDGTLAVERSVSDQDVTALELAADCSGLGG